MFDDEEKVNTVLDRFHKSLDELVDDYVAQVIKSVVQFEKYLTQLLNEQKQDLELDYTLFRELAHKNLGVARNLRIKNAETLLYELMTGFVMTARWAICSSIPPRKYLPV